LNSRKLSFWIWLAAFAYLLFSFDDLLDFYKEKRISIKVEKKGPKGDSKSPLEPSYGHLLENLPHRSFQKVKGYYVVRLIMDRW
jgi:hypothetical protein